MLSYEEFLSKLNNKIKEVRGETIKESFDRSIPSALTVRSCDCSVYTDNSFKDISSDTFALDTTYECGDRVYKLVSVSESKFLGHVATLTFHWGGISRVNAKIFENGNLDITGGGVRSKMDVMYILHTLIDYKIDLITKWRGQYACAYMPPEHINLYEAVSADIEEETYDLHHIKDQHRIKISKKGFHALIYKTGMTTIAVGDDEIQGNSNTFKMLSNILKLDTESEEFDTIPESVSVELVNGEPCINNRTDTGTYRLIL